MQKPYQSTTPLDEPLSEAQFKALHVWFKQVSEVLNNQGLSMNELIKYPVKPTPFSVKEFIFKPILFATFGKTSTKQLSRRMEIDEVIDTIRLALNNVELPAFPSSDQENFDDTYKIK